MTIRTVEEIISQFRTSLEQDNSDLSSFERFGNLYMIFRAVALSIQEQDVKLDLLQDNLFLNTATGEGLDRKALEFNIIRKAGTAASGGIIILGNNITLPSNLILSDNISGLQFRLLNRVQLVTNRATGTIECVENTPVANLAAGTRLSSSLYPSHQFIIGNRFDPLSNNYIGNLIGGTYREEDDELRERVTRTLQTLALSTVDSITNAALNINGVSKVSVKENSPALGYITVYINTNDRTTIKQVENSLNLIKPVGTALQVTSFTSVNIDVELIVTTFNSTQIRSLTQQIQDVVQQYITSISLNTNLTREGLAAAVFQIQAVANVEVLNPVTNININDEELLNLGTINITYR